jgi:hypothetical protein
MPQQPGGPHLVQKLPPVVTAKTASPYPTTIVLSVLLLRLSSHCHFLGHHDKRPTLKVDEPSQLQRSKRFAGLATVHKCKARLASRVFNQDTMVRQHLSPLIKSCTGLLVIPMAI